VPSARVPDLKQSGDLQVIEFPSTYIQYVTFNTRNAPLNDVNARLAISYATDRKALVDVVLFGTGVVATTFMPKGALYWTIRSGNRARPRQSEGLSFEIGYAGRF